MNFNILHKGNKCEEGEKRICSQLCLADFFPFWSRWNSDEVEIDQGENDSREKTENRDHHLKIAARLLVENAAPLTIVRDRG